MTEPTRTSTGIAYLTYDATLNTDASMIIQQKLDLSGNTTAQTFCENAFDLAAGEDISGALLADSDITYTDPNSLVYLGSNDVNVQKTFLNNKLNSSIAQNIACNAYEMTLGKNNQIPLVSNLGTIPPFTQITETKIVASDRASSDNFGNSVAISGNYAIVGAYVEDHDANGNNEITSAGSAYIFEKDSTGNWSEVQKIVASDRASSDLFGLSVAIDGNYVIVAARYEDHDANGNNEITSAGSAYIFERDSNGNWSEAQKIVASDRASSDIFGSSVSISGNYVIVGAFGEKNDVSGNNAKTYAGSAYIFERDSTGNWNEVQKIVASDREAHDRFGQAVGISGNYAIVGSYLEKHDASGNNEITSAGSVYIFERDSTGNWSEVQKIVASDRASNGQFGTSIAISGNYAIMGAYQNGQGSAYIFERDSTGTWSQVKKLVSSDIQANDRFYRVAIDSNYAIVGAQYEDDDASGNNLLSNAGSVYIFERDSNGNWSQLKKIVASDRTSDDYFGYSVAISGNYFIVGANKEDHDASGNNFVDSAGSAYIFEG
jgi:hypothetical protein